MTLRTQLIIPASLNFLLFSINFFSIRSISQHIHGNQVGSKQRSKPVRMPYWKYDGTFQGSINGFVGSSVRELSAGWCVVERKMWVYCGVDEIRLDYEYKAKITGLLKPFQYLPIWFASLLSPSKKNALGHPSILELSQFPVQRASPTPEIKIFFMICIQWIFFYGLNFSASLKRRILSNIFYFSPLSYLLSSINCFLFSSIQGLNISDVWRSSCTFHLHISTNRLYLF